MPQLLEIHRKTGLFSFAANSRASRTDNCHGIDQTFSVLMRVNFWWICLNSVSVSSLVSRRVYVFSSANDHAVCKTRTIRLIVSRCNQLARVMVIFL